MAAITFNAAYQKEQARKQLLSPRQAPGRSTAIQKGGERPAIPPADRATATAPFRPLDPDIVSEAIPAFFIGRNKQGFWVARDVNGRIGGIFLRENSALSFARMHSGAAGCATIYPSERFELDLENQGNPLVVQLASLIGFARHPRGQPALSTIRQFLAGVLTLLAAGTAVAAIMALKIAIFLPRFVHH